MTASSPLNGEDLSPSRCRQVDHLCDRFESAWQATETGMPRPHIEEYLGDVAGAQREVLVRELVLLEIYYRQRRGEKPSAEEYRQRFLFLAPDALAEAFAEQNVSQAGAEAQVTPTAQAMQMQTQTLASGQRVGDYELLAEIARGGMGVVYRARHIILGRVVALKMILAGQLASESEQDRFRTEAQAAAHLDHPHIAPLYQVGEHQGLPFLCMKFLSGGTLAQHKQRFADPRDAARLLACVTEAVHHAHQRGILHRDLKPANILLDEQGQPHVTDFGLAKRIEGGEGLTQSGAIVGTPGYLAPEQARGQSWEVTTAVDVWGLGAILYELLTGQPPFRANTPLETVLQVLQSEATPPSRLRPGIPRDLETICLKCLQQNPHRRYASAQALADDLHCWLRGEPITARAAGTWERTLLWAQRHPVLVANSLLVLLVLTLGSVVGVMWNLWQRADAEKNRAVEARESEGKARQQVEQLKSKIDGLLYANRLALAQREWKLGNLTRASQVLHSTREDLRGWEYRYLDTRFHHLGQRTFRGHKGPVNSVRFSRDGKRLVSGGLDGTAKVWDVEKGTQLFSLEGHRAPILSVDFSADGKRIATGSDDGTTKVWNALRGQDLRSVLGGSYYPVHSVRFSPDGRSLCVASGSSPTNGGVGTVWDYHTGQEVLIRPGHTEFVSSVCFSADWQRLVTSSRDRTVKVWDLRTGTMLLNLTGHTNSANSAGISADGKRIVSGSSDGTIKVWDAITGKETLTFEGHNTSVSSVGFSPDGKRIVSGSEDKTIRIWDAREGHEIRPLKGHTTPVACVTFSPDGSRLASTGSRNYYDSGRKKRSWVVEVKVWDANTGQQVLGFSGHRLPIRCLTYSPDGKRIATASNDKTVKLWSAQTGQEILSLKGHTKAVRSVAFSPDAKRLASTSDDKTVKVWNAHTGKLLRTLKEHTTAVHSVCFSPDGNRIASTDSNFTLKVWKGEKVEQLLSLRGRKRKISHTGTITCVCFSPDGNRLASASTDRTVKVWDVSKGPQLFLIKGHTSTVTSVAYNADGTRIVTGSEDHTARVWDAQSGSELLIFKGHSAPVRGAAFSPDGLRVVTGSDDRTVKVWDSRTGSEIFSLVGHLESVRSVCYSPDGTRIASGSADETVKVWDAFCGTDVPTFKGHKRILWGLAISPDSTRLATASYDKSIKIWNFHQGTELLSLTGHTKEVNSVAFSPSGQHIATGANDHTVIVWDARKGQQLRSLKGHTSPVYSVAYHPKGGRLASASGDHTVKVWDAQWGKVLRSLQGHAGPVFCVAYSLDSKRLASASDDHTVKVWDADQGQELLTLQGHLSSVYCVCFSPDGKRLASAGKDRTITIWDASSGERLRTLRGHKGSITCVAYSPDGQRLASASGDHTIKIWDPEKGLEYLSLEGHNRHTTCVAFTPDGSRLASASYDRTAKVWEALDHPATPDLEGNPLASPSEFRVERRVQPWPMFGGSPQRNMANPSTWDLPYSWSVKKGSEKHIKWKAQLGTMAYGGPVIADGRVFVGTNNQRPRDPAIRGDKGVMMCFRQSDGEFLWQITHDKLNDKARGINPENNDVPQMGVASTPVVDGNRLYYVSNRCEVICADVRGTLDTKKGKVLWKYDMVKELGVYPCYLAFSSPVVAEDQVFVITANGVNPGTHKLPAPKAASFVALNKHTGKLVWKDNSPGKNVMEGQWSSPVAAQVKGRWLVVFAGGDGWLYALEARTGKLVWKFDCNPKAYGPYKPGGRSRRAYFLATPVIWENKLYIATGSNPEDGPGVGHLWCIDITREPKGKAKDVSPKNDKFNPKARVNKDSALVWHHGGAIKPPPKDGRDWYFSRTLSTVAIHDGLLSAAEMMGYLQCLDARTGKKLWEYDMLDSTWSSPYYADGKVYMGTDGGILFVFQAGPEKKLLAEVDMRQSIKAPPVAVGSVLYINTGLHLYAIEKGR